MTDQDRFASARAPLLPAGPGPDLERADARSEASSASDCARCRICRDSRCELLTPCWCEGSCRTVCAPCLDEWRHHGRQDGQKGQLGWGAVRCEICGAPWLFEAEQRGCKDLLRDFQGLLARLRHMLELNVGAWGGGACGVATTVCQGLFFFCCYVVLMVYVFEYSLGCVLFALCCVDAMRSALGGGWLGRAAATIAFGRDRAAELRQLHEQEWQRHLPPDLLPQEPWGAKQEQQACLGALRLVLGVWAVGLLCMPHWSGPIIKFTKETITLLGRSQSGRVFTAVYVGMTLGTCLYVEANMPPWRLCRGPDGAPVVRGRTALERASASPELRALASPALRSVSSPALHSPALGPL